MKRSKGRFDPLESAKKQFSNQERQDAEELKARLEANEGLSVYTDYVQHLAKDHQDLHRLLYYLDDHVGSPVYTTTQHCSLFDVIVAESREIVTCKFDSNSPQALDILEALRDISTQVSLRIIIWHLDIEWTGIGIINTLGITLRLDPRFFSALFARITHSEFLNTELRPLYAQHVVIGNYIVTFGTLDISQETSIPYVLIASPSDRVDWVLRNDTQTALQKYSFHQDICSVPLLNSNYLVRQESPQEPSEHRSRQVCSSSKDHLPDLVNERNGWYTDILRRTLNRLDRKRLDVDSLLLSSLFPLYQLSSLSMRDYARQMRPKMVPFPFPNDDSLSGLRFDRRVLRRQIEDTEDDMEHLQRYIRIHEKRTWLKHPVWQMLEEESNQSLAQARRVEAEARDYLQVESGSAALEETKKSIQLSNSQIEESRRVKIFTVLAFVYVPLNLATSIFGMNLQQLNNNGRPLSVFVITAILALVGTGIIWFCLDQYNGFIKWKKDERQYDHKTRTKFNLTVRLAMLWWLVRHRHVSWMRRSGAWPLILEGSTREPSIYPVALPGDAWYLSATEYVSKFMLKTRRLDGFDAFAIDPVSVTWEKSGRSSGRHSSSSSS